MNVLESEGYAVRQVCISTEYAKDLEKPLIQQILEIKIRAMK